MEETCMKCNKARHWTVIPIHRRTKKPTLAEEGNERGATHPKKISISAVSVSCRHVVQFYICSIHHYHSSGNLRGCHWSGLKEFPVVFKIACWVWILRIAAVIILENKMTLIQVCFPKFKFLRVTWVQINLYFHHLTKWNFLKLLTNMYFLHYWICRNSTLYVIK